MEALEASALAPLDRSHRPAAAEFGVLEAVDEVRLTDEQVDVERPVLAIFEAAESVQGEGLGRSATGPKLSMQEQAVPPQPLDLALYGRGVNAELPGNLTERRTPEDAKQQWVLKIGTLQPVGGREGL